MMPKDEELRKWLIEEFFNWLGEQYHEIMNTSFNLKDTARILLPLLREANGENKGVYIS